MAAPQMTLVAHELPPRFRGVLHLVAFVAAVPVGIELVVHAKSGTAQVGASVFAVSVVAMLGASSLFHRGRWTPVRKRWLGFLDHGMIYVLIAGTYTPFALLVLNAGWRAPTLAIVWGGGMTAFVVELVRRGIPAWASAGTCLALGWMSVVVFPQIVERLGLTAAALLVAGGLAYSVGAVVYARRRPDPFPGSFGYHEIFHTLVVVAVACQYSTIAFFVLPRA